MGFDTPEDAPSPRFKTGVIPALPKEMQQLIFPDVPLMEEIPLYVKDVKEQIKKEVK